MQISKTRFVIFLAAAFVAGIILTMAASMVISGSWKSGITSDSKIQEIKSKIDSMYLEDYDEEELVESAYAGYVYGLGDQYSQYMTEEEYESWNVTSTGDYTGVGITFSLNDEGYYEVESITEGSPADKANIKEGDYIIRVNGKEYSNTDVMASDIRGKEGTEVTLRIFHKGKTRNITLVREKIVQQSEEHEMLEGNIGYIKLESFISSTANDFSKACSELEKKGAEALILDLRDNGGGLVDECVKVADYFLDEGVVCYVEDKNGNRNSYDAEEGKTDMETVVLVNGNSASASEIVTAAMKDNGYKVVGEKTFGKGVIQTSVKLDDGSALKLTVYQYLSPKGNKINKEGVSPTYSVKDKKKTEEDEQLEKAKDILTSDH